MSIEFVLLASTAATIGFLHTILGPDHYLPFIVLAKARKWNTLKTIFITFLCGVGHILSSVLLGLAGVALGVSVIKLKFIESLRGDVAAWLLIIFGCTYFIWGIHRAVLNRSHEHIHIHEEGDTHEHLHTHLGNHSHVHGSESKKLTPWVLFIIFIFGPCEPLIPLIMYPAATKGGITSVVFVAAIFGSVTILTMLSIVMISIFGLSKLDFQKYERYSHMLAGLSILLCGSAIKILGI